MTNVCDLTDRKCKPCEGGVPPLEMEEAEKLLTQANDANALSFLTFNLNALLHGEVWRLVTFVFVPAYSSPFALLISLYFYYWIGSTLERQWGTAKFNLYYISGALLGGGVDFFQVGLDLVRLYAHFAHLGDNCLGPLGKLDQSLLDIQGAKFGSYK